MKIQYEIKLTKESALKLLPPHIAEMVPKMGTTMMLTVGNPGCMPEVFYLPNNDNEFKAQHARIIITFDDAGTPLEGDDLI